ncbi:MAG: putative Mg2+ transporter-C (MgtC) family protein [Paraburkholderia sp.]|nr:putative Mg2+ transporter-C (MgtC) family protein [Paraburkholderia sp.]
MTIEFVWRLLAAFSCGVAIGLERQMRQRNAGLRTITLVASGACLFVTLGVLTGNGTSSITQIAAYVVSGVGFLGGGVIMRVITRQLPHLRVHRLHLACNRFRQC